MKSKTKSNGNGKPKHISTILIWTNAKELISTGQYGIIPYEQWVNLEAQRLMAAGRKVQVMNYRQKVCLAAA
jgi:hypothetical protein